MTAVNGSIREPGLYSGSMGFEDAAKFRRNAARFRQLDTLAKDVHRLKQQSPV